MLKIAGAVFVSLSCAAASAANFIDIESGMWGIDGEVNGKPGRGLQIDEQGGNLVIVTYFGYRPDGSSLFYQASGPRDNDVFVADLIEYKNGPPLTGPITSGELAVNLGPIRIDFESATKGLVTLPGQSQKAMTRLQFYDPVPRFTNWSFEGVVSVGDSTFLTRQYFGIKFENGLLKFSRRAQTSDTLLENCEFTGPYSLAGKGIKSSGNFTCAFPSGGTTSGTYESVSFTLRRDGTFSGEFVLTGTYRSVERYYGFCVGTLIGSSLSICRPDGNGLESPTN